MSTLNYIWESVQLLLTQRDTFATRLAQRGIDIYKISTLLGHHSIEMTQRYAHHCSDSLKEGVQILEVGHNLVTVEENRNVSIA